jgi:DNA-binding NarL/FixJ family response regulator
VIEQFEQDGFRYRLVRRPVEPNDATPRLTKREMQVLDYAVGGHSNKSIAYALGLSPSTVGVLLFRAATKLEAKSRIQLLLVYAQMKKSGALP